MSAKVFVSQQVSQTGGLDVFVEKRLIGLHNRVVRLKHESRGSDLS